MKKALLALLFTVACGFAQSQPVTLGEIIMAFGWNDTLVYATSNRSITTLNAKTGVLKCRTDISSFNTGIEAPDHYMHQNDTKLIFTGTLSQDDLRTIDENNSETFRKLTGTLQINHVSRPVAARYKIYKINNNREDERSNMRVALQIEIDARDFNLDRLVPGIQRIVKVELNEAVLNKTEEE